VSGGKPSAKGSSGAFGAAARLPLDGGPQITVWRRERAVGLTDKERRTLDELAESLARDHPHLARELTRGPVLRPYQRWLANTLLIVAPPLIVLGFVILQTLVVTIGCVALIAGTILVAAGSRRLRRKRPL
jgi:hypothetical protein